MEIIEAEPLLTSYISIAEHQSRTPESFYSGPLVLYHLAKASRLAIDENDLLHNSPALLELATVFETNVATSHWHTVGSTARDVSMEGVDVWVTSEYALPSSVPLLILPFIPPKFTNAPLQQAHPLPLPRLKRPLPHLPNNLSARNPDPSCRFLIARPSSARSVPATRAL